MKCAVEWKKQKNDQVQEMEGGGYEDELAASQKKAEPVRWLCERVGQIEGRGGGRGAQEEDSGFGALEVEEAALAALAAAAAAAAACLALGFFFFLMMALWSPT